MAVAPQTAQEAEANLYNTGDATPRTIRKLLERARLVVAVKLEPEDGEDEPLTVLVVTPLGRALVRRRNGGR